MRIRGVKQIEGLDHDDDDQDHEVIKKELVEEFEQGYERPTSDDSLMSIEDNLTLAQLSNTPQTPSRSIPSLSSMGTRKKPKETTDNLSQVKKKKPSRSRSKHVLSDHAEKCVSCKQHKAVTNGLNSPGEVKSSAMIRAEEVRSSLGPEFPSFVKLLVRSHVASCFWMGLPVPFCKLHLPRNDATVIVEDETGEQFEVKFIAEKTGLSAGWRKFAVGHKLLEGDVLIFQLVEPNKLKVYVIRANDLAEVDGALSLLNLDAHTKQNDAENTKTGAIALKKRKRPKSLPLAVVQKKNKKTGLSRSVPKLVQPVEQSENDSEVIGSEVVLGSKFSGSAVRFRDIRSFEEFNILVNELCMDSELPEHIRIEYYELCCSKNAFLHARLLQGLNCTLVAGIISETVNIADAMRACKVTTSRDEFAIWEKSLKSFELLGMNVGFLRARLRRLQTLAFDSEGALDTKRYMEAKTERVRAKGEIRNLEAKLVELKEASEKFDADIETLKSKAESYELTFQEEVDAPW
uniref:TF-B3 domain-containing protein n=1 Tax=Davidia involucrata TaxID=16924 RepID=A0A5B6YKD2_DAVIN